MTQRRICTRLAREAEEIECEMVGLIKPRERRQLMISRRYIVVIGIFIAVAIVTIIIVATTELASANSPVMLPITVPTTSAIVTLVPTAALVMSAKKPSLTPEQKELAVACNFLSFSNLAECQAASGFMGRTVGNTIPTEIGLLTRLSLIWLRENQVSGTIPSTLGNLKQLVHLSMHKNQLSGTIPSTLGHLTGLTYLSLFNNTHLTGTVPSTLGRLTRLTYLSLSKNQLSGNIPSILCSIPGIDISIDCVNVKCMCCREVDQPYRSCPST
jgi:hypothetical protein